MFNNSKGHQVRQIYEIVHLDKLVASITTSGICEIFEIDFMPYNLYLEEDSDLDTLVNNITNFYYWCASRILTLDRKYAKEILNSLGLAQAITDKERANIALAYRCVSLTDVYWVRRHGEQIAFSEINLYENHLANTFVNISLLGKQYAVNDKALVRDLATQGCFPKAWVRTPTGFQLYKDGGKDVVERELLASKICRCFIIEQVLYNSGIFDDEVVSISDNITSKEFSIASIEAFELFTVNHDKDILEEILSLDKYNYYMMNVIDYLVGNIDRHWGNWGVLVNNKTNKPVRLHKLMDFNQSFLMYDTLEGANCQTSFRQQMTQKEAALLAVKEVGLNQTKENPKEYFSEFQQYYDMFKRRLQCLKEV